MNFKFPLLTTASHFGGAIPNHSSVLSTLDSIKLDHVPFPKMACVRVGGRFMFSTETAEWNSAFHSSFLKEKNIYIFFYGDLKNVRYSLIFTWFQSWSYPLSLHELFGSYCFDFLGTAEPLRLLARASSLQ